MWLKHTNERVHDPPISVMVCVTVCDGVCDGVCLCVLCVYVRVCKCPRVHVYVYLIVRLTHAFGHACKESALVPVSLQASLAF